MSRLLMGLIIIFILPACLVSRTERPRLTGYVCDADSKQAIEGCMIGETKTDVNGFYELKEKRYRQFTIIGMEAPPVFIHEIIEKKGYINDTIT